MLIDADRNPSSVRPRLAARQDPSDRQSDLSEIILLSLIGLFLSLLAFIVGWGFPPDAVEDAVVLFGP